MWDWLTDDAKAVIALVALAQPWLYWLYTNYWKKGTIDVYRTGSVEVGFSSFGGTIGVQGTLRAVHGDLFISRMEATLVRVADNSTRTLEWGAFRPFAVLAGSTTDPIEMPSGFLIQPIAPRRYNIIFFDTHQQAEFAELTTPLSRLWNEDLRANNVAPEDMVNRYRNHFSQTQDHVNVFTATDRAMYWQRGEYRLSIQIFTTRPSQEFTDNCTFTLTDADVRRLRTNSIPIIRAALGLEATFDFVYVPYQ